MNINVIKSYVKRTILYQRFKKWSQQADYEHEQKKLYAEWLEKGKPVPAPHIVKQMAIKEYAQRHGIKVLVETGTYLGEMIKGVMKEFKEIYSVELSTRLYIRAAMIFSSVRKVVILHGNSGEVLGELLPLVDQPCLFWLDAHYSEGITAKGNQDTPIVNELSKISQHVHMLTDVILIDDARCFGVGDYPSIQWLQEWSKKEGFNTFEIKDDIIRISVKK